jgi:hypothetical protein
MHKLCAMLLFCCTSLSLVGQQHSLVPKADTAPFGAMQREIATSKNALLSEFEALEAARNLRRTGFEAAIAVGQKAVQGTEELNAILWIAGIYKLMQCDTDRDITKAALKNRLGFYASCSMYSRDK